MKNVIATLPAKLNENAKNYGGDKEMTDALSVIALTPDGDMREVIVARCYMGRSRTAQTVYASVWIRGDQLYGGGTGKAGGYGYCKRSAAIAQAIRSAGIELDTDIGGAGMSMVREALLSIATAMGYRKCRFVEH